MSDQAFVGMVRAKERGGVASLLSVLFGSMVQADPRRLARSLCK